MQNSSSLALNPQHDRLYGLHPVRHALINPEREGTRLYITEAALPRLDTIPKGVTPKIVTRAALDKALGREAVHQGVLLTAAPLPERDLSDLIVKAASKPLKLLALDQVTDPHNVGAILRSASCFGCDAVITPRKGSPQFLSGVLAKAAAGAVEHIPFIYVNKLSPALQQLKERCDAEIIGLDEMGSLSHQITFAKDKTQVLVLGAEGPGMRPHIKRDCTTLLRLPTSGPIGTLNVSNATAVGLALIN